MNIFLIVITTFEENFVAINKIRRKQCEQYNIPVLFIYNGNPPDGFVFQNDELCLDIKDENNSVNSQKFIEFKYALDGFVFLDDKQKKNLEMETKGLSYPINPMNPIMLHKFIYAVNEFYKEYRYEPAYFIRCTASCFIDFNKLPIVLRTLPNTNCIAGIYDNKYDNRLFCNGTCMIISNDVAKNISKEDVNKNMMCIIENDDVAISWLGLKYGYLIDTTYWFAYYEGLESLPSELKIVPNKTVFYRIKNVADRKTIDVGIWNMLYNTIDIV